jgi:glyoxylase-like metal-dependent hydrolase (beta-lactamase superfamily II)
MGCGDEASNSVQVIHTPGHTPDEIALYYAKEWRLFVGDSFYQWQPITLRVDGESFGAFECSVLKLLALVESEEAKFPQAPPIVMCCGHVDDFLPAKEALQQVVKLIAGIKDGSLQQINNTAFGAQVVEYRLDSFSIGFLSHSSSKKHTCCRATENQC